MLMILAYHSIDDSRLVTSVRPDRFGAHMAFFADQRYQVLALDEVIAILKNTRPIPPRCTALTFDDGYRSVYTNAMDHLLRYSFPATVFITSGHCGGLSNWPSHPPQMRTREMLTTSELKELRNWRITIGAHTVHHHHLPDLPPSEARQEIERSQVALEQITGGPLRHFAYPYGEHNDGLRRYIVDRFDSACGVDMRFAKQDDDVYALPRIDAQYLDEILKLGGPESTLGRAYLRVRRSARILRRALTIVPSCRD